MQEKNKAKFRYFLIPAAICLILLAAALLLPQFGEAPQLEIPAGALALTDTGESTELLTDARQWNLSQLEQHQVYLLDNCLYVDFLFTDEVDADQLDRARSFVLSSFSVLSYQYLGAYPYRDIIKAREKKELIWEEVRCRIWQEDELLYEDVYDKIYNYYEESGYPDSFRLPWCT